MFPKLLPDSWGNKRYFLLVPPNVRQQRGKPGLGYPDWATRTVGNPDWGTRTGGIRTGEPGLGEPGPGEPGLWGTRALGNPDRGNPDSAVCELMVFILSFHGFFRNVMPPDPPHTPPPPLLAPSPFPVPTPGFACCWDKGQDAPYNSQQFVLRLVRGLVVRKGEGSSGRNSRHKGRWGSNLCA